MINSQEELQRYLEEDKKNNSLKKIHPIVNFFLKFFFNIDSDPIWKFIVVLRKLEYYSNCPTTLNRILRFAYKCKFRKLSMRLGFSIPINVLGPGVSIPHYGTIVINPHTRIGKNCRIHVGTNIGMHKGKAPVIGDNVYIGPGAILFGDITIADNTSIAANSTVSKSVLETNTVIAGTPAIIIKNHSQPWNYGK